MVRGAVVDVRNGICELQAAVTEAVSEAALADLAALAVVLANELLAVNLAAAHRLDELRRDRAGV